MSDYELNEEDDDDREEEVITNIQNVGESNRVSQNEKNFFFCLII